MAVVNVESLLKPLDGENPCGENLRWDRRYLELERLAEGKEEVVVGAQVTPAEEPDWREVRDVCVELLGRGRQLRILVLLTLAAVRQEGYPGLRDGLKVVQGLLEQNWDKVWPQLDAEDNNDPTERVNSLAAFWTPIATFGDKLKFLDRVMESPICESRQLGRFSLKDIQIASGQLEAAAAAPADGQEAKPKPTLDLIDAAFVETDKEVLQAIVVAADEAHASAEAIETIFRDKCGDAGAVDLRPLKTLLKDASVQVNRRLGVEGAGEEAGESTEGGGGSGQALAGDVGSTRDVLLALDKIVRYYESREKSSPVPLIVKCAQRMVDKDFMEIVKVLGPDVVTMLSNIANPPEQSS